MLDDFLSGAGRLASSYGEAAIAAKFQNVAPAPAVAPDSGRSYTEGKPAPGGFVADKKVWLIGGGVAALVVLLVLLKR
jgi:hypothetical protein